MKILFAQLRKPPCESRFFDRLGKAFNNLNEVTFHLGSAEITFGIGTESKNTEKLLPVFRWPGNGLGDSMKNLLRLLDSVNRIRPDVLIFSSPEISLLLPIIKISFPCITIIFDLQENHGRNIRHQIHPSRPRKIHGAAVDFLVWWGMIFSSRIWLAEKVFSKQLNYFPSKTKIFENLAPLFYCPGTLKIAPWIFCFTGFITRESGITTALGLMDLIFRQEPRAKLLICGYCPDASLRREIMNHPLILFTNDPERWASSAEILACMKMSSAQLMPYFESKANAGKTPSKWYASLAAGLPVWHWKNSILDLPLKEKIGFGLDMKNPDPDFYPDWLNFFNKFSFSPRTGEWNTDIEEIKKEVLRHFPYGEITKESTEAD